MFAANKAALRSFERSWSVDLRDRRIRVNVVSPGTIITPGHKTELGLSDAQIEQIKAEVAATTPRGRPGTPDEIANASPASSSSSTAAWPRYDRASA